MLIRQGLNFTAHFLAGLAVGAIVVVALGACRRREEGDDHTTPVGFGPKPDTEPSS
jgi:hypothetical protein